MDTESSSSARSDFRKDAQQACGSARQAFDDAADAFLPPEEVRRHFRQARIEVWKGIRELVDRRISNLSRERSKGTRVVVE